MNLRKRTLKDSTGFNEDANIGVLKKRKKLDPVGEIKEKTHQTDSANNPSEANGNVNTKSEDSENSEPPVENAKIKRRKCPICSDYAAQKSMKNLTIEDDKFILAAIIPDLFVSQENIDKYLKIKRAFVCFSHFVEASTRIEKYIHDPKVVEKMLMPKIRSIIPNLSTTRKGYILAQFLFRNSKKRAVKAAKDALNYKCYICKKLHPMETMNKFSLVNTRIVIALGRVLNGKLIVENAHKYLKSSKEEAICRKHAKKSIETIRNILHIQNTGDIDGCSAQLMKEMMVTVKSLLPDMTTVQFKKSFKELVEKLEPSLERNETIVYKNRCCAVCYKFHPTNKMSPVSSKSVRTLIMVGCVLKGTHTLKEAIRLIESDKEECTCHKHFKEAIEEIYKLLEISDVREIDDCSSELIRKMMETVNNLLPSMIIPELKEGIRDLARKNEKFVEQRTAGQHLTETNAEEVNDVELIQEQAEATEQEDVQFRCGVCQLVHPKEKFIRVKSKKSKMMIMIGCILRETHTMEEAEQFITSGNKEYSCRRHFRKSIKKICELLEIETLSKIFSCSVELMNKLMVKVNGLLPDITLYEFQSAVLKLEEKIEMFEAEKEIVTEEKSED